MTPFAIRWNIDDRRLRELRPDLNAQRIRRLYFEDAALQWSYVVLGWPRVDNRPLRLPNSEPFTQLSINVIFEHFQGAEAEHDVARVDAQGLQSTVVTGPHGTRFPYEGTMHIDLGDIERLLTDRPRFKDTVVHEIGHVLGLGTLFPREAVHTDNAGQKWYTGTNGRRAYAKLLGAQMAQDVPLQAEPTGTTPAYHWDERALPRDIMSTRLDQPGAATDDGSAPSIDLLNVISPVSAGTLMDLGYLVDMTKATRTAAHLLRTPKA